MPRDFLKRQQFTCKRETPFFFVGMIARLTRNGKKGKERAKTATDFEFLLLGLKDLLAFLGTVEIWRRAIASWDTARLTRMDRLAFCRTDGGVLFFHSN